MLDMYAHTKCLLWVCALLLCVCVLRRCSCFCVHQCMCVSF